ncbi:regulatory protein GemA [Methylobacterium sp. sgz302541]|uniref:regulatory protein GemA n=1 Tax=unclassified Methylobacterium TaxID=2615210 RepID=UPI003D34CBB0
MISPKRVAVVQVARRQLGLDEAQYRAVLHHHGGGAASAKDLDEAGFEAVMAYFNAFGFRSTWMRRSYGNRPGMASPKQVALIRGLHREWSGVEDEAALNRWLDASFKVSALRFLTAGGAQQAITALRSMTGRGSRKPKQRKVG